MADGTDDAAVSAGHGQPSLSFDQLIPARIHKLSDTVEEVALLMLGEAYELGFTETRILAYLRENNSASVADISRDLRVDKAWISRRLQSLATKKLISKDRDVSDSRVILVALTGKGNLAAESAMAVVRKTYSKIVKGVDEKLADRLITKLEANLHAILSQLRSEHRTATNIDNDIHGS